MTVLIIAAHPDDEVLGCGGTIAHHTAKGDVVEVVIVGEVQIGQDRSALDQGSKHHPLCHPKALAVG